MLIQSTISMDGKKCLTGLFFDSLAEVPYVRFGQ
jgi:hypothetical protein